MELLLSIFVFLFGILTWVPFLNNIYGQDLAVAMYFVDRFKKGEVTLYKDIPTLPIGYFMHIFFMQLFWKKENTKAFYWIMCLYSSFSSFLLFWVIFHIFGLFSAIAGSIVFSLYIVSPRLDGNWGASEQLIPLPLMISLLCILISSKENSIPLIVLSGLFLGYAILIKQMTVLYFPCYILVMIGTGHSFAYHLYFICGILITNSIPLVYFSLKYDAFWEYVIAIWLKLLPSAINPKKYNKYYPKNQVRGTKDIKIAKKVIAQNSRSLPPLFFLCIIGVFSSIAYHSLLIFAGLFVCLLASIWMIFMRGTFFPHYWLNMIPWLSIFAGFGLSEVIKSALRLGPPTAVTIAGILAIILLFVDAVCVDRKYYGFFKDPYQFLRKIWGEGFVNAYKGWRQIGEYIKNTTKKDDKILVCGWAPHILMYSDRTHFTPEACQYTEDYLDIYNRENPAVLGFLNLIYNFKNLKVVKQKENIFHAGYPEVIVFSDGKVNVEGFEKLTGIKYSLDENVEGCPLFRADLELTELMSLFQTKNNILHHCCPE